MEFTLGGGRGVPIDLGHPCRCCASFETPRGTQFFAKIVRALRLKTLL